MEIDSIAIRWFYSCPRPQRAARTAAFVRLLRPSLLRRHLSLDFMADSLVSSAMAISLLERPWERCSRRRSIEAGLEAL